MSECNGKAEKTLAAERYAEYNKALRTWFVAFGVGGPVILLTNKDVFTTVKDSGQGYSIAILFMSGAALQIIIALINKYSNWYNYYDTTGRGFWVLLGKQIWIDLLMDVVSSVCFAWATVKALLLFTT